MKSGILRNSNHPIGMEVRTLSHGKVRQRHFSLNEFSTILHLMIVNGKSKYWAYLNLLEKKIPEIESRNILYGDIMSG